MRSCKLPAMLRPDESCEHPRAGFLMSELPAEDHNKTHALESHSHEGRRLVRLTRLLTLSLAVFAFAFACRLPRCTNEIFLVDSANYVRAANNGVWSQYVGLDGMSVVEFLRLRRAGGVFRQHPWGALSDAGDGAALRHFHAPMSFYVYALTQRLFSDRPSANRIITAIISSAIVALLFGIALFEGVPLAAALIGTVVLSLSPALLVSGTDMTPHPLFSLSAMSAIAAFALYWRKHHITWLVTWIVLTAVAIATLEFSTLLIAAFVLMLSISFFQRRSAAGHVKDLKRSLLAISGLLACLFVLWPAGFIKGGYALSYGTLIFQGTFRQREQRDLLTTLIRLGSGHLWMGLLYCVLLGIGLYSAFRSRHYVLLATTALYALLMFLEGKGNGFSNPTYASQFLYAIVFLTLLSVPRLCNTSSRGDKLAAVGSICILVLQAASYCVLVVRTRPEQWTQEPARVAAAINQLKASYKPGTTFVINNYAESMTTYAPDFRFVSTLNGGTLTAQPWEKIGPHYLLIYDKSLTEAAPSICVRPLSQDFWVSCDQLAATSND